MNLIGHNFSHSRFIIGIYTFLMINRNYHHIFHIFIQYNYLEHKLVSKPGNFEFLVNKYC